MSRVGKKPIIIPKEVEVEIKDQQVLVKGPKGQIYQEIPSEIKVEQKEGRLFVFPGKKTKKTPALWGLLRAILQNHIKGVEKGFEKKLEIQGIGYRASVEDNKILKLEVGFSHSVKLEIPKDLNVSVEKNIITVAGTDKQKVGQFAAEIRKVRPPEPYKGKGIRYLGERVRRKEGKKAATTTG